MTNNLPSSAIDATLLANDYNRISLGETVDAQRALSFPSLGSSDSGVMIGVSVEEDAQEVTMLPAAKAAQRALDTSVLLWEEPTFVEVDNIEGHTRSAVQECFAAILNSAADQLLPLFPARIIRGLNTGNLHPDILRIAHEIEQTVLGTITSDFAENASMHYEKAEDEIIKMGETVGEAFEIDTARPDIARRIETLRRSLKLLGHIVAERMLDRGDVTKIVNKIHERYLFSVSRTQNELNELLRTIEDESQNTLVCDMHTTTQREAAQDVEPKARVTRTRRNSQSAAPANRNVISQPNPLRPVKPLPKFPPLPQVRQYA